MIKELVGRWKVIGCQLHGKWLPPSIFSEFIYVIHQDGSYNIEWANLTYPDFQGGFPKSDTGRVKIINDKEIDFIPDKGPFEGKSLEGLHNLDHDILKSNVAFPGNHRPNIFSSKQGEVYEVWQRIK
jgi:hypothetical protein